jgi:hypothetical protein
MYVCLAGYISLQYTNTLCISTCTDVVVIWFWRCDSFTRAAQGQMILEHEIGHQCTTGRTLIPTVAIALILCVSAGGRVRHPRSAARRHEAPGRQGSDANSSNCADSAGEYRSPVPNLHSRAPRQVLSLLRCGPPLLIHSYCIPATTQLLASPMDLRA